MTPGTLGLRHLELPYPPWVVQCHVSGTLPSKPVWELASSCLRQGRGLGRVSPLSK